MNMIGSMQDYEVKTGFGGVQLYVLATRYQELINPRSGERACNSA